MQSKMRNGLLSAMIVALLLGTLLTGVVVLTPSAAAKTIEVTVTAKETGCPAGKTFCFEPAEIQAEVGDTIVITLVNDPNNEASHDLRIDEFGVQTKLIKPGEQDVVTFTVDRSGSFAYYCTVPGHRTLGMEGILTVAGAPSPGPDMTLIVGVVAGVLLAIGVVAFIVIRARQKK